MRQSNDIWRQDNPLQSNSGDMYQSMADGQMTRSLSSQGRLGLADLIVRQLSPQADPSRPLSLPIGQPAQAATATASAPSTSAPSTAKQQITSQPDSAAAPKLGTPMAFVKHLMPMATKAAQALGVAPKVLLAQAALETGYGKHVIQDPKGNSSHNLFNIKAHRDWQGPSMVKQTLEFLGGQPKMVSAPFRAYDNFQQSFQDYVQFLRQSPRYQSALQQANDPARYLQALQKAGYATDPQYANKILSVMQRLPNA